MTASPFDLLADPSRALAAHAAMPAGTPYKRMTDDPETAEEIRAERERQRVAESKRRAVARMRAAQHAARVMGNVG